MCLENKTKFKNFYIHFIKNVGRISKFVLVLGPSLLFGEPSSLIRRVEPSQAFFRKGEPSQAELFAFKAQPKRAFGFSKLSNF